MWPVTILSKRNPIMIGSFVPDQGCPGRVSLHLMPIMGKCDEDPGHRGDTEQSTETPSKYFLNWQINQFPNYWKIHLVVKKGAYIHIIGTLVTKVIRLDNSNACLANNLLYQWEQREHTIGLEIVIKVFNMSLNVLSGSAQLQTLTIIN